ncbi:MAG: sel1 repeat family protein [Pseudomonadota bacterium]|nr:sel1 repeat family protein [Pseudomonadota bacterium]
MTLVIGIRRHRFALLLLLLSMAIGVVVLCRQPAAVFSPLDIDRLRMRAAAHDVRALGQLELAAGRDDLLAQRALASVLLAAPQADLAAVGLRWARVAAQRGDAAAQYLLGKALFERNAKESTDRAIARVWLLRAADQQHPQAAYLLGLIYKEGYAVAVDRSQAAGWFMRAAALGNADAMFMLGNAYLEGDGVPRDQNKALALWRQAAELEQPLAAQMLSYALRDGALGLQRDLPQSEQMMVEVEHALHHPREVL